MKKIRILLSGGGGSLFPWLFEHLSNKYDVWLTDANDLYQRFYPPGRFVTVPLVNDPRFGTCLNQLMKDLSIDYYIPLIDEELLPAHNIAAGLDGTSLISPSRDFIACCLDKLRLMGELADNNISRVPSVSADTFQRDRFPVFVKPRTGRGSRGSTVIGNAEEWEHWTSSHRADLDSFIVQDLLKGTEYTVSVVVNSRNDLIAVVPKKILIKKGITLHSVTVNDSDIESVCREVVDKLTPRGPFNVQLIKRGSEVCIFEINPRFSTTTIQTIKSGVDEIDLTLEYHDRNWTGPLHPFQAGVALVRRWESLFYIKETDQ